MKRWAAGQYRQLDARSGDGWYAIERGWADAPATDRRRQTWVLLYINGDTGYADILSEHRTLHDARRELERRNA